MNPESREIHASFRAGVRSAISAQAAFEGPPRKAIGWKEVRETWMAAPRRILPEPTLAPDTEIPSLKSWLARILPRSGPVGSGQKPMPGRPKTAWLTSGDRAAGSGWRDDAEAEAVNDAVRDGRYSDVAVIRAMFAEPTPTPGPAFDPPSKADWADDCSYAREDSETLCAPAPRVNEARDTDAEAAIFRANYGDEVNIASDCPASFETLLRVVWTFLVDNEDIIRWATCLVHGKAYQERIVEKLTQEWFLDFKADIWCDNGNNPGGPCTSNACPDGCLALSWAIVGITICTATGHVDKWVELFEHGTTEEKLCGVIEVASLLVHELTHVALTLTSGDKSATQDESLHDACARSHLVESIWRWAIYQRFPQALEAECCSELFEVDADGAWDYDEWYMSGNPAGIRAGCEVVRG